MNALKYIREAPAAGVPTDPTLFTPGDWAVIAEALRISADVMHRTDGDAAVEAILDVSMLRLRVLGKVPTETGQ